MKNKSMSFWQKRIFFLCLGAYAFAYFNRINLSVAIPLMEENIGFDKTNIGLIGSSFFWIYAIGQLINGRLGDKFKSRYFIFIGLLLSATASILFSFSTSLFLIIILWGFNGFFQSILWGPLIKTLHRWFPKGQRPKVVLYIFSSIVIGFILTWGGLGQIIRYTGWKGAFWLPGIILSVYSLVWVLFVRNSPSEVGLSLEEETSYNADKTDKKVQPQSFFKLILHSKLYMVMFAGIPLGFVREGISLWGPTLLYESFRLDLQSTMGAALLIPIFNFFGVISARLLITKFIRKETKLVAVFFAGGVISCIFLYLFKGTNIIIYLGLLAICSLCLYGASSIVTSVIPLKYYMPSSAAGFLDFSIYLGAGLSGIITGFVTQKFGWSIVVFIWIVIGMIGSICAYKSED